MQKYLSRRRSLLTLIINLIGAAVRANYFGGGRTT